MPFLSRLLYETACFYDEWRLFFDERRNETPRQSVKLSLNHLFSTKTLTMEKLQKKNAGKLISRIYEYQRFIKLNLQFIQALEEEGADTTNLRAEIEELEGKIMELKLRGGFSF